MELYIYIYSVCASVDSGEEPRITVIETNRAEGKFYLTIELDAKTKGRGRERKSQRVGGR